MQFTFISDTHGLHHQLDLPGGDVLIHAGDISSRGTEDEVIDFLDWFKKQNYQYKIFVAGNHDWFFQRKSVEYIEQIIPQSVIYLNDSGVTIQGVKFWGSPVQPTFYNWAFNRERGVEINKHWQLIPDDTGILITHGPPKGILDKTIKDQNVGCEELTNQVQQIEPKVHIFGHIHESYGIKQMGKTLFINASVLNLKYQLTNEPIHKKIDTI